MTFEKLLDLKQASDSLAEFFVGSTPTTRQFLLDLRGGLFKLSTDTISEVKTIVSNVWREKLEHDCGEASKLQRFGDGDAPWCQGITVASTPKDILKKARLTIFKRTVAFEELVERLKETKASYKSKLDLLSCPVDAELSQKALELEPEDPRDEVWPIVGLFACA